MTTLKKLFSLALLIIYAILEAIASVISDAFS